jgi:adenylate cyclase
VALLGIAAGVVLAASDAGQRVDWYLYDQYMRRLAADNAPAPDVVVVAIDELSFAEVGMAWPWPRSLHAALVDQLVRGGARTIAFDIVFDVPGQDPEADQAFAEAIGRAANVVLAADQAAIEDRRYAVTQWSEPIEPFAQAARAIGAARIPYDPDGVLRTALLHVDGRPSLAFAVASQAPGFTLPAGVDPSAPQLFRYNGLPRRGIVTVSFYQALDAENSLPSDIFAGKHVLIGRALAAPSSDEADHFSTPVALQMAGVEIHATIVDALLRDRFLANPVASTAMFVAICVLSAAIAIAALYFVGPATTAALVTAVVVAFVGLGYLALQAGVRLPVAGPAMTIATAYAVTTAYRYALVSRERRQIKRAFQHYVAPAIVEQMLRDPAKLKLGGEQCEVTVLFSDLEGFTTLAEQLTPSQLSARVGEYFSAMLDVLLPQHGTLDKLIGDSIMMYFGCPLPDPAHAEHACRGALAMQQRMTTLNEQWSRRGLPPLRTRIGINTGTVVAGNMGTTTIFNYTVLGDCVNLASRLEGVNKQYGTLIVVGEDTWKLVHASFEGRELDWIRVKGRLTPVAIYELVGERGQVSAPQRVVLGHYANGLALYRAQRWSDALVAFETALQVDPDDGPSRTLAARCAGYVRQPPSDWDGVHVMSAGVFAGP